MKTIERMTAPTGTLQIAARFDVTTLVVMNSTAYTIGIRLGALDTPNSLGESDIWVPPAMYMTFAVFGREFGLAFMLPQLALQPEGMPTEALIIPMSIQEPVPMFSSIPLATIDTRIANDHLDVNILNATLNIASGIPIRVDIARATISTPVVNAPGTALDAVTSEREDVLLYTENASTGHSYPYTLTEPRRVFPGEYGSNIRSMVLSRISTTVTAISVIGRDSGHVYADFDPTLYSAQESFAFPFYSGLDSSVSIQYTQSADETDTMFKLTGHRTQVARTSTSQGLDAVKIVPNTKNNYAFISSHSIPASGVYTTFTDFFDISPLYQARLVSVYGTTDAALPDFGVAVTSVGKTLQIHDYSYPTEVTLLPLVFATGENYNLDIPLNYSVPSKLVIQMGGKNFSASAIPLTLTATIELVRT